MITRAVAKYIRITPRKFRQIIPLVKGKSPEDAIIILMNVNKKASIYAIELLKSALANAKRVEGIDLTKLYISRMFADCGPQLKRWRAASMGRASQIRKRTSHITVELDIMKQGSAPEVATEAAHAASKTQAKAAPAKAGRTRTAKASRPAAKAGKQKGTTR